MTTHSSIFAWKFHGQRSLVGYSPWGCKAQASAQGGGLRVASAQEGSSLLRVTD